MEPVNAPPSEIGTDNNQELPKISFEDFAKVHIHVGTILTAEVNQKARKPAYVLTIDFGGQFGIKTSSAQIVSNYQVTELVGRQVTAVLNFAPKDVAGVRSEVLVLGILCPKGGTILLTPVARVENGSRIL